jgi:hypothetical protein
MRTQDEEERPSSNDLRSTGRVQDQGHLQCRELTPLATLSQDQPHLIGRACEEPSQGWAMTITSSIVDVKLTKPVVWSRTQYLRVMITAPS